MQISVNKNRRPRKRDGNNNDPTAKSLRRSQRIRQQTTISDGTNEPSPAHDVVPLHQVVENGVRFNVQTVSSLGERLDVLTASQTAERVTQCARQVCSSILHNSDAKRKRSEWRQRARERASPKVEQHSFPTEKLIKYGPRSLMQICLFAFASHYPLVLSPQHVWLAIAYGAAKHIDQNAEALRTRFVSFKGKKELEVRNDELRMGNSAVHEWESGVFHAFSHQIRANIGNDLHQLLSAPFSTSSKAEIAAAEITLMAATARYFSFELGILCGIPYVQLEGTLGDWMAVRERAGRLNRVLLCEFADKWLPNLLPVLDEFVSAYMGNVNHAFWQRMVKEYSKEGSGASPVVSGWINNLYPYLEGGRVNQHIKPWQHTSQYCGPNPNKFPKLVSSVAVKWNYFEEEFPLHFHAGYFGMTQDADTRALRPYVGWLVTHDQPHERENS
ncbi:hypothetical protein FGB62_288g05 [Gracilaria domingensis]|nr:hypothetical protein FGB62_288g05 [Gracilaria domingensis]